MDACDYRGQTVVSVIDDCAQTSGKNYWVMPREDLGASVYSLWYDFPDSTAYASAITISNVAADVDSVSCFAAAFDTALTRDPSRVYSGVYMPYEGGAIYQQLASTSSNFQARDTTSSSYNVKTAGRATARAIRYLADIASEEDRITTAIIVPNAQVNALREGHLVYARFSHLPGYETSTACRVLNRTVVQVSEEFYRIEVELSPVDVPAAGASCIAADGHTYEYTTAGFREPLGLYFDTWDLVYKAVSTDFMGYWSVGQFASQYPLAGSLGAFSGYSTFLCGGSISGVDWTCGGIAPGVRFTVVGPGTLTIETRTGGPGSAVESPTVTATASISGGALIDTVEEDLGTDVVVTIPDDGGCAHYIDINGSGGTWGFAGATWTPA